MGTIQETQFIKNNVGKDVYAVIPIDRYNELIECEKIVEDWEDERDLKVIEESKNAPVYPAEEVFAEIRKNRAV